MAPAALLWNYLLELRFAYAERVQVASIWTKCFCASFVCVCMCARFASLLPNQHWENNLTLKNLNFSYKQMLCQFLDLFFNTLNVNYFKKKLFKKYSIF